MLWQTETRPNQLNSGSVNGLFSKLRSYRASETREIGTETAPKTRLFGQNLAHFLAEQLRKSPLACKRHFPFESPKLLCASFFFIKVSCKNVYMSDWPGVLHGEYVKRDFIIIIIIIIFGINKEIESK